MCTCLKPMTFFHLRTYWNNRIMPRWTGWPDSTVTLKLTVQTPDLPIEPPRPLPKRERIVMVLSHQISSRFWPLSWRHKKRLHPLFFWGGVPISIWNVQTAERSYWVPYTFSNHSLIIVLLKSESQAKPQTNQILIVWVMFFLFPKDLFGKRICKLHRYVFATSHTGSISPLTGERT